MLRRVDLARLLQRIGHDGAATPCEADLRSLHRAFVTAVPFENFDIHIGRRIVLDEGAIYEKVVARNRGGFCFELNGLFAAALREVGFDATLLSARLFDADGALGRDFVHAIVLVNLGRLWIADVGFGDWSAEPLRWDADGPQAVDVTAFRITPAAGRHLAERQSERTWTPRYSFDLTPRRLADFAAMCDDLQTAPDSAFRRRLMCTRQTPSGRVSLVEKNLIVTRGVDRRVVALDGVEAYREALAEHFGIELAAGQLSLFL